MATFIDIPTAIVAMIAGHSGLAGMRCMSLTCSYFRDAMIDTFPKSFYENLKKSKNEKEDFENYVELYIETNNINFLEYEISQKTSYAYLHICTACATHGLFDLLKIARSKGCYWNSETFREALRSAHKNIIVWLHNNGCPYEASVASIVAGTGNIEMLKWLDKYNYSIDKEAFTEAVMNNQVDMLHFLYDNWGSYMAMVPEDICSSAAASGNIHLLNFVKMKGGVLDTYDACIEAAKQGHLHILNWLVSMGCELDEDVCAGAAQYGHFDILKWARDNGCEWDSGTCYSAALGGHLKILKWARAGGCEWSASTCEGAARRGHLDVLQWARDNGCEWDYGTCVAAAQYGHLDVLKWARDNGCGWNCDATYSSAINGHYEVLQWLYENGCPMHPNIMSAASQSPTSNIKMLKWLYSLNIPMQEVLYYDDTCDCVAQKGRLDVLQFLHEIQYPQPFTSDTINCAAMKGHTAVVEWLFNIGIVPEERVSVVAASKGHIDVLYFLYKNGVELSEFTIPNAAIRENYFLLNWLLRSDKTLITNNNTEPVEIGKEVLDWISQ